MASQYRVAFYIRDSLTKVKSLNAQGPSFKATYTINTT